MRYLPLIPVFIVIAFFGAFSFIPKWLAMGELQKKGERLEMELQIAEKRAQNLPKLRQQLAAAEAEIAAVHQALPEKNETAGLTSAVHKACQSADVTILELTPGAEIKKDFYSELPMALKLEGKTDPILSLLDQFSVLPRLVNVSTLTLASDEKSPVVVVDAALVAYRFIDESAYEKIKRKKKRKKE